jgi:hypothetical protein
MKELAQEKYNRDALVAQLWEQGVRYLAPSQVDLPASSRVSSNELILRLSSHPDARLRLALVALLILRPSWGSYVHSEMHDLAEPLRTELQALYTAAVYLQRLWHTRLRIYLGKFDVLPDLYSSQLGLPAAEERHGKAGLHALSAWQARRSPYLFNWLSSYNKVMNLLFGQLKMEAKQSEPAATR